MLHYRHFHFHHCYRQRTRRRLFRAFYRWRQVYLSLPKNSHKMRKIAQKCYKLHRDLKLLQYLPYNKHVLNQHRRHVLRYTAYELFHFHNPVFRQPYFYRVINRGFYQQTKITIAYIIFFCTYQTP